ncbi:MAG: hypothetical protein RR400_00205 [Clostridia bacterium]
MQHELLKVTANLNSINELSKSNLMELVLRSEKNFTTQIKNMLKVFLNKGKNYKVILLSGPSSSGKTTSSKLITTGLQNEGINSLVISLDDFFVDRTKTPRLPDGAYDYESIYALDLEYFNEFLDDLLTKHSAKMPIFDFLTGARKKDLINVEIDEHTVIIFEGIHALNPILIDNKHSSEIFRTYICLNTNFEYDDQQFIPAKDLRLMRRCLRDFFTRGHSVSATLSMWKNVLDGEEKYIKPFKDTANFVIDSTHLYEPLLYATYLMPLLEQTENNKKADSLLRMLSKCNKLEKNCIPSMSLLWEFIQKD